MFNEIAQALVGTVFCFALTGLRQARPTIQQLVAQTRLEIERDDHMPQLVQGLDAELSHRDGFQMAG